MSLKAYRMTLTAIGPVFVGNGKEYIKKEYVMLPRNLVGIADMNKLYALSRRNNLARRFEDFMLGKTKDQWGKPLDLSRWLEQVKLKAEASKTCLDYTLDMGDTSLTRGQRTQIMACMKDAYGRPYIPGSSLKGALRTIIAANKIMDDTSLRDKLQRDLENILSVRKSKKYYLAPTAENAETEIFRKLRRNEKRPGDAVNDIMQGFIVGDSAPVTDKKALVLAQKIDRSKDGTEKCLNLLRESLRPGTKIEFPLTINEEIFPFTAGDIIEAVYNSDEAYNQNFLAKFDGIDPLRPDKPQIYLGGGAGFVSKTLIYPIMGQKNGVAATAEIFKQTGVSDKHKHYKDKGLGVSPHIVKCTHYQGQTLQMGLCEFNIEEA